MTVKLIDDGKLWLYNIEDVGDHTIYVIALADVPAKDAIYVALGGHYAPTIGGMFPVHTLHQFGDVVRSFAEGNMGLDFFEAVTDSGPDSAPFWYMYGKQVKNEPHKWDLIVAFIVGWLFSINRELVDDNNEALTIIGALYKNEIDEVRRIMNEVVEPYIVELY